MTEEQGCWNCKHDELGPDDEPCNSCVSYDPVLTKWEQGSQVKENPDPLEEKAN